MMGNRAFCHWLDTSLGDTLVYQQKACVAKAMARVFGTRHLEVGIGEGVSVAPRFPGWQQPLVVPEVNPERRCYDPVIARPEELPFHGDIMDSVILHHTLDLTDDPRQALREGVRVLRSGGRLIVVGFNPFGFWGLRRLFSACNAPPWNSRFMPARRILDWLGVLDCCVEPPRYSFFRPPLSSPRLLSRLAFLEPGYEGGTQVPFGGFYCLVAEKRESGSMRLYSPARERKVVTMPVANRNMPPQLRRTKIEHGRLLSDSTAGSGWS